MTRRNDQLGILRGIAGLERGRVFLPTVTECWKIGFRKDYPGLAFQTHGQRPTHARHLAGKYAKLVTFASPHHDAIESRIPQAHHAFASLRHPEHRVGRIVRMERQPAIHLDYPFAAVPLDKFPGA